MAELYLKAVEGVSGMSLKLAKVGEVVEEESFEDESSSENSSWDY
jgi:hypothetical protein